MQFLFSQQRLLINKANIREAPDIADKGEASPRRQFENGMKHSYSVQ